VYFPFPLSVVKSPYLFSLMNFSFNKVSMP
jgi:hypothetical protein